MNKCERCGSNKVKVTLKMEEINIDLCTNCYDEFMSEEIEVDLEQLVETFSLKNYQGISRTFYVERRICPMGIYLEAVENIELRYDSNHAFLDM
ncbi:isocitrate dehydrogenase kinase/phosphatase [Neobacillus niacini]|uniref:DUF7686 domain-containing protein n=1 Tax=Neobacillus niacini TaxID=86668 RepID=UPI002789F86D|nr:hypothetical protein [Neobacillus niacini]MDQ1000387.1 isocitrate dehydrogenase kinase/phosphatase [Neobacillus niacini]